MTGAPTTGAPTTGAFIIRDAADPWEFRALEDVQVAAWGYRDREVTPGTMLRIGAVTGGIVVAAYPENDPAAAPVGFAYGFPARVGDRVWHHSHLLAVRPEWRGSGLAVALKHAQRDRARAQGLSRMTWTFDPLVPRNARLNLGKLGAVARSYHPDWYALEDDREAAFPADRLMVEWDLTRDFAERPAPPPTGTRVLEASADGLPAEPLLALDAPRLLAEVPLTPETLPTPARRAWRIALRAALGDALARGYVVTDLARDGDRAFYVMTREAQKAESLTADR